MKISRKWRRSWERCQQLKKDVAGLGRVAVAAGITLSVLAGVQTVYALPSGGSITAGQGQITHNGNTVTVTQNTDKLALNWQSFNIGKGEKVQFYQPGTESVALNRIVGSDASKIYGQLSANGKVFLINTNGILFAPTSQVNVGGLVATSLSLSDSDFLNGKYTFTGNSRNGAVINQGSIRTADGGYAVLLGGKASNEGVIVANKGSIALGAGSEATLDFTGDGLINLSVSQAALDAQVTNSHLLQADGGLVVMTARAAGDLTGAVVNNTGTVRAQSLVERDGKILLDGSTGWVQAGGTLDASGQTGRNGGQIEVSGQTVSLTGQISANGVQGGSITATAGTNMEQTGTLQANGQDKGGSIQLTAGNNLIQTGTAKLTVNGGSGGSIRQSAGNQTYTSADYQAKGAAGGNIHLSGKTIKFMGADANASGTSGNGGTITIGGGWQGAAVNGEANADSVVVGSGSTLSADGGASSNGGKIVVWSEQDTAFAGVLSAAGGKAGGQMEVSGKENLLFAGKVASGRGKAASLLLDPKNITVVDSVAGLDVFSLNDPNARTGNSFGTGITALSNGNIVVTSTGDNFLGFNNAGAVYLFNGTTGELISTLRGSHESDMIGSGGVTALTNGNYVVTSSYWDNGNIVNAGAITWGSGTNGVSGVVSSTNSLVGTTASDILGGDMQLTFKGVTALTNGNYVVVSPNWSNGGIAKVGAVTWGDGNSGVTGTISSTNSLVGTHANDRIGYNGGNNGVTALTNGNYVVASPAWANGTIANAGAVTWGHGEHGITGAVTNANSLVGTTASDIVGTKIVALGNGNYVVISTNWTNSGASRAGAVTWGSGTSGVTGAVSSVNSLVGTKTDDMVGYGGVRALTNDNYVVLSSNWANGEALRAGAVTWGSGTSGVTGAVSSANSLVGTTTNDSVGSNFTALTNGNYVVSSYNWNNGSATRAGAVTWGDGISGVRGAVSSNNSLVGTTANDQVGNGGVTALTNGNYVVSSLFWNNSGATKAGAVTWGDGASGVKGAVSSTNSLVGTVTNDMVGSVTALANGNYVVSSAGWDNGGIVDAGAVTWGDGRHGITGAVSSANSLVGTTAGDLVGNGGVTALTNGNYVVRSYNWNNGSATRAGAATWGNGEGGVTGAVSSANSLVGSTIDDMIGGGGILQLTNGNYVVQSAGWDKGSITNAGAVTWGDGTRGVTGEISSANSLVGTSANDLIGNGVDVLTNGNYVVSSQTWDNGSTVDAGAVTWGDGSKGVTGEISSANSLVGVGPVRTKQVGDYVAVSSSNIYGSNPLWVKIIRGPSKGDAIVDQTYSASPGANATITASSVRDILKTGTELTLQANNDITVNSDITVTKNSGVEAGGDLTLTAGRSVYLNGNIATDGGSLTVLANDTAAHGVVDDHRDSGQAVITMTAGTAIDAGTGRVSLKIGTGEGLTHAEAGNISLQNVAARRIDVTNTGSGNIELNGVLNAGTGTVSLSTGGTVNQLAGLTAGKLLLGSGTYNLTNTGNRFAMLAADGAGDINLYNGSALTVGSVSDVGGINASGNILLMTGAGSDLTLNRGVTSTGGDITLVSGNNFINTVGSSALTPGSGHRWLVYSADPAANTPGGLSYQFKQYNASFGDDVLGEGNGFLYTLAPTLTVGLTGTITKTYDGSNMAAVSAANYNVTGNISGDTVNLAHTTASYNDKNAGSNKTVTAGGLSILSASDATGAAVYGYQLTGTTASGSIGNIDKATINGVTGIAAVDKVYNGTRVAELNTGSAGFSGMVEGDSLTVATASGEFSDKNAGSNKAVAISGITLGGSDAGNYTLAGNTATANASISKATISSVSGIAATDKVYDGTRAAELNTGGAGFSGMVEGDSLTVATASGEFSDKNAGTDKTVIISGITLGGSDAGNYTLSGNTAIANASISKATISRVTGITATDKVYDGSRTAALNTGNASFSGIVEGDSLAVGTASGEFSDKNAGSNKAVAISGITLGGSDAGNYTLADNSAITTGDITRRQLVVTAKGQDKYYDGTTQATVAYSDDRVGGDNLIVDGSAAFADPYAGVDKPITISELAATGTDAANYILLNQTAGVKANILPKDQIETAIKHSSDKTIGQPNASGLESTGEKPQGSIEIVQDGMKPANALPAAVTVTPDGGNASSYQVAVNGSEVTVSRQGQSTGMAPSQKEITVVDLSGAEESKISSYVIRGSGDSLSVSSGTAAANTSAQSEPSNDAPATTYSLAGLDGETAKFQAVYEEGTLSIRPLNDSAAAMSKQKGHTKQLVIAAGIMAAQENLGTGLQSVNAVYIH